MATPFRADQVGSLLRPPEVLAAREAHEQGDSSLEQLRQVEDRAVLQALEMLRSVGIEIFSDGELRRGSFLTGPADALQGFRPSDESFLREWHGPGGGMLATTVRIVATRLEARRFTDYEIAFLKQHSPGPFKITMPTPSMLGFGGFREGITDQFYADSQELHQDLARIIRAEIQAAIDDGAAYIQLDAPNYPMRFCDQRLRQQFVEQGIDVESELTEALAADQASVQGIDRKGLSLPSTFAVATTRAGGRPTAATNPSPRRCSACWMWTATCWNTTPAALVASSRCASCPVARPWCWVWSRPRRPLWSRRTC